MLILTGGLRTWLIVKEKLLPDAAVELKAPVVVTVVTLLAVDGEQVNEFDMLLPVPLPQVVLPGIVASVPKTELAHGEGNLMLTPPPLKMALPGTTVIVAVPVFLTLFGENEMLQPT